MSLDFLGELFSTYEEWHYFVVGFFLALAVSVVLFVSLRWMRFRVALPFLMMTLIIAMILIWG